MIAAADLEGNPWERRRSLGYARAFVESAVLFVVQPKRAFGSTRESGGLFGALLFVILISTVKALVSLVKGLLQGVPIGPVSGARVLLNEAVVFLILLFLGGMWLHFCLHFIMALEESRTGIEGTIRVVAYSGVAVVSLLLPVVAGAAVWTIWTTALWTVGLAAIHRTSPQRALMAITIFWIPLIALFILIGIGFSKG